ncbi:sulfotransferase family protein [Coleofasciculus chthonoplastes]|uniref:sulfotransferase family protein n=1 Tax=Coleofasciculus chthonoplastes TaxID=64178 RepID=UPI0033009783
MKQQLPNFLLIGAAHAGTTALYYFCQQHPQIYMSPIKETNYFAFEGEKLDCEVHNPDLVKQISISNIEKYYSLFQNVSNEKAIGEASPSYISSPGAAQRIQECIPNAKIVAILRHPVDRAYSETIRYSGGNESGLARLVETLDITKEDLFQKKIWRLPISKGLYHSQLERYFAQFNPDQIKVLLYEDLKNSPQDLMKDLFNYLGVDAEFIPDTTQTYNKSGQTKNKLINKIILAPKSSPIVKILKLYLPGNLKNFLVNLQNQLRNKNMASPVPLPPDIKQKIIQKYYREDILKLQDLIQRDLSSWLV